MTRPTLKDVAAASGYSSATVAFILRGHPKHFPAATRSTVLAVAERLGYRANASARAIRSGRMGAIALVQIADDLHGDLAWSTFEGITSAVEAGGDHLVVTRLPSATFDDAGRMPKILRQLVADGAVLSYHTGVPAGLAAAIRAHRVPAIWINSRLPEDCVHLDDLGAAATAVARLRALGHRRIAYINTWHAPDHRSQHYSMIDRRDGYRRAMAEAGLPPAEILGGHDQGDVGARCRSLLAGGERPTAMVLYHSSMAPPVLLTAASLGLDIPGDLSLVTFSDRPDVFGDIRLTAVRGVYGEMGATAVAMLRQAIADPDQTQATVALVGSWYEGTTCMPPRRP